MTHPAAAYWDRGVDAVPSMTGLHDGNLDPADLRDVCAELWIALPVGGLLDVGCGTGRASLLVHRVLGGPVQYDPYLGVDISQSAVTFCQMRGIKAMRIEQPEDLRAIVGSCPFYGWVWACSVFTHIGRYERQRYLAQFARIAPRLLVDILPDCDRQDFERWGADDAEFRADLAAAGYRIEATADRRDERSNVTHRYFKAVQA